LANSRTLSIAGVQRQIALVDEDIKTKEHLLAAGLVRKPDVLVLQRTQANLEGEVGRIMGDIGDSKERVARAVEQINGVRKTAIKTAFEQMHEVRGELVDVRQRHSRQDHDPGAGQRHSRQAALPYARRRR
jgi:HlyD family secretion protein